MTSNTRPRRTLQAALAAVLVPLALAGCGDQDDAGPADERAGEPAGQAAPAVATETPSGPTATDPTLDPTPDPTPGPTPGPGPGRALPASDAGLGQWDFGAPAASVLDDMAVSFGEADVDTGWEEFRRIDGHDGWYRDGDPISDSWDHRFVRAACWESLCSVFGGSSPSEATFTGWELSVFQRWNEYADADPTEPRIALEGSGIRLGDTWADFRAAYPRSEAGGGEGASLVIDRTPWPGIFDGAGAWRMDGSWDFENPTSAPDDAAITRMSGGTGPEPGCC